MHLFLNGPTPASFCLFSVSFEQTIHFLQKSIQKMSCSSSIWCWDSKPQPFKHELSPITTRPGILPLASVLKSPLINLYVVLRRKPTSVLLLMLFTPQSTIAQWPILKTLGNCKSGIGLTEKISDNTTLQTHVNFATVESS